ncbi:MAG: GNAT family N-acetyltransferase [Steroidobacteraceae bacterium]
MLNHTQRSGSVCQLIPSLGALEEMRSEWMDLYGRCRSSSPFQAPAWVLPWGRHFAPDRLRAIAACEGGTLVALVPFFTWNGQVLLAGTGPTDYCDGLFASEAFHPDDILTALAGSADQLACECIDLQQLPRSSALLDARTPRGWLSTVDSGATCPVAILPPEDALAGVSPSWRRNITRAARKLGETAGLHLDLITTNMSPEVGDILVRLHSARWQERGQPGVLNAGLMRPFLSSVLPELSSAGLLRLHLLRAGDQVVAAVMGLQGHGLYCFYISGFDPKWSRYSPGNIALAAAMCQAAKEGAREFHFLRGQEPYKYRFAARDRLTCRRILTRAGTAGAITRTSPAGIDR